jgi:hypothetical protein
MPLHSILTTILAEYPKAKIEPFGGNPLANFLRHQAADEVQNALGDLGAGLTVEGSAGAGNWAVVPWISVFDPAINHLRGLFWLLRIVPRIKTIGRLSLYKYIIGEPRMRFEGRQIRC